VALSRVQHRHLETNGIRLHVAEQGEGPMVVLCHGFPESWYSWRHQLQALADAGFHAVAPDMRGYGQTDAPADIDQYTIFHLVGDMVGLMDALRVDSTVIVGHDWGATVAWHAALFCPDRFRAVIGLSVPFRPRGLARPLSVLPRTDDAVFYQVYFQAPGVAEMELERDVRRAIQRLLYSASGDASRDDAKRDRGAIIMVPRDGGLLTRMSDPGSRPAWFTEADVDFYTTEFERAGFRGGLNWYRNIDRNWELLAPFAGARIPVPALYIVGDLDPVLTFPRMDQLLANLPAFVPQLRHVVKLPGCGHWTQQERPEDVNASMLAFLRSL
jgi:pimeloyl-ACP methyl ester carboxylesterase